MHLRTKGQAVPFTSAGQPQLGLRSRSLFGLAAVQFLTVLNDNTFRWLVVPIGYVLLGTQHRGLVLSLGLACFVVPYIVLVAPAAFLADRYSKQRVIAGTMLLQAGVVALGVGAILMSSPGLMFATLTLMGAQGALLGPAKSGTIPEVLHPEAISAANGVLGMASVGAAVVGSVLGNFLFLLTAPAGRNHWWLSGLVLVGIALLGWAASLLIVKIRGADPDRAPPRQLFGDTLRYLGVLRANKRLLLAAAASGYFWFLAALAQVNIYLLGSTMPGIQQEQIGYLLAALASGAASGSVLAGVWSARQVELGLVPLGAGGIAITSFMMFVIANHEGIGTFGWSLLFLFLMGVSSGVYEIPLSAYLQYYSPERQRGQVLAAANFIAFSAMLIAAIIFWVMHSLLGNSAGTIFLLASILTGLVFLAAIYSVPRQAIRALLRPLRWLETRILR